MNLFKNPLKIFEEENEKNFLKIKSEGIREEVQKLVDYIITSPIYVYQMQIVRKDLIGMALEAELDGISLEEKLGRDPREFCDDVISSVGKRSPLENVLKMALYVVNLETMYYVVGFFIIWGMPKQWGITIGDILAVLSVSILCGIVMRVYNHKMSFNKNAKFYSFLIIIFAFSSYGIHLMREIDMGKIFLIRGNGWVIMFVLLILAGGVNMVWNRYWAKIMKNS